MPYSTVNKLVNEITCTHVFMTSQKSCKMKHRNHHTLGRSKNHHVTTQNLTCHTRSKALDTDSLSVLFTCLYTEK